MTRPIRTGSESRHCRYCRPAPRSGRPPSCQEPPPTTVAVVGTNTSGVVTLWSSGAAAMFDWTEEEALGRPIAELADWGLSRKDVTEFLFVGTSGLWVHEHEVTTRTGRRMRLKTTASLVAGVDGVEEILASSTRIELPEGRTRLSMTERPFRALLERGSDLVVICDRNLVIGYAGPSLWRMFGCLPRQVIGHSGWDYVHPQDLPAVRRDWEGAVSGAGEYRRLELRIRNGEGIWRWIEVRISNLVSDVSIGAMVLNVRDVTEQHEIAEALAASEHLLQTIVDASVDGVCILDPDGSIVLANYRMAEMLAVDHTRLLAGHIYDFFDEETSQMLRQRLRQRALGVRELYEFSFRRLDGQHRWLRVSGRALVRQERPVHGLDRHDQRHHRAQAARGAATAPGYVRAGRPAWTTPGQLPAGAAALRRPAAARDGTAEPAQPVAARAGAAVAPRDRGGADAAARRPGAGDRPAAVHQPEHRAQPPVLGVPQAAGELPAGADRAAARAGLARPLTPAGSIRAPAGTGAGSAAVVDGLHVVAVRVAQEHPVVAGVVLRPLPRRVQHRGPAASAAAWTASTACRSAAVKARWTSRVSAPAAGLSQKAGLPSGPARPTSKPSGCGTRIASVMPRGANTRR